MCGIAGIATRHGLPMDPQTLRRMCGAIAHRGPDGGGYAFFGEGAAQAVEPVFAHQTPGIAPFDVQTLGRESFRLGLGHRRLAILDLSPAGHQPMDSPDGRYWITYNGEIYNFPELREELRAAGCSFRSGTDTEVLLRLWEREQEACLERLNGMFAFVLYDRRENLLFAARDRFGVKPLYYALTPDFLLFASETKAILHSGLLKPGIEPAALVEYLTFQNLFGARTLFEGVRLLEPGEFLRFRPASGEEPVLARHHKGFPAANPALARGSEEDVRELFESAVRRQLVSDVEVGAYLSGGMDSGSIVAVASRFIPRLLTFTGGFDLTNVNGIEQGFDERAAAERLSYLMQTEHYAVVLHAGDMPAAMERIAWHMDDPRVGMCHQNWYVAKLASRFVKVCLAGTGGDELFGGYPWRYLPVLEAGDAAQAEDALFASWQRLLPAGHLSGLLAPELRPGLDSVRRGFEEIMAMAPAWERGLSLRENLLCRVLHFEFKTFLHGLLVTEDRISMAHGLETRVPFLDNDLADVAFRLSPGAKVDVDGLSRRNGEGHIASAEGKRILRRAMEPLLPGGFTHQPKQGFSPPDANWYRGPSMDYIKAILLDQRTLQRPWFDHKAVQSKLDDHFAGRCNNRLLIWSLLSLEWLQRHFVDAKAA